MTNSNNVKIKKPKRKKSWMDYLYIWSIIYFALGFFNILFAWLGLIDFILPLIVAIFAGNKYFCNNLCGRGQLFWFLGNKLKLSRKKKAPKFLSSNWFRYGFLAFFLTMFANMVFQTYLVFSGTDSLRKAIKLFWTFKVPWKWAYNGSIFPDWVAKFGFGFYSLMLTSTLIGLIVMLLFKERTWCSFCPMGTMTQGICKLKAKGKD
jgi:polyferredoxin